MAESFRRFVGRLRDRNEYSRPVILGQPYIGCAGFYRRRACLYGSVDIMRSRVKRLWILVLGSTYGGLLSYSARPRRGNNFNAFVLPSGNCFEYISLHDSEQKECFRGSRIDTY